MLIKFSSLTEESVGGGGIPILAVGINFGSVYETFVINTFRKPKANNKNHAANM